MLRRYRERLAEETGLDPSEELARTETAILKRDLDLLGATAGAAAAPTQLPPAPTSLIGRDDTLAAVVALLRTSRLVTLVGPGGIGKTRLALAAAHRWGDEARWVDLAPGPIPLWSRRPSPMPSGCGNRETGHSSRRSSPAWPSGRSSWCSTTPSTSPPPPPGWWTPFSAKRGARRFSSRAGSSSGRCRAHPGHPAAADP